MENYFMMFQISLKELKNSRTLHLVKDKEQNLSSFNLDQDLFMIYQVLQINLKEK
jgi:hypothetical protein